MRKELSLYRALSLAFQNEHRRAQTSSRVSEHAMNGSVDSRQCRLTIVFSATQSQDPGYNEKDVPFARPIPACI